jgi:hypothetical protein
MFVVSSMTIPELLRQNRTDTESFSGIATARAVLPHPQARRAAPCSRLVLLADPNPAAWREHAAAAVTIIVIGPIVETRPYSGEEEVPPKAEVMKAIMVEVREVAVVEVADATGEESMAAEAATTKTAMTAETSATMSATVGHRAGRHCCGAQADGRRDRNQACLPPHTSLSFCQAPIPRWQPSLRSSGAAIVGTKACALPVRIFVARCEEDHVIGITKRAAPLKLLMRQFLTDMSVCKCALCASYLLSLVGEADDVSDAAPHPGY